jgi:hypothetical protein
MGIKVKTCLGTFPTVSLDVLLAVWRYKKIHETKLSTTRNEGDPTLPIANLVSAYSTYIRYIYSVHFFKALQFSKVKNWKI